MKTSNKILLATFVAITLVLITMLIVFKINIASAIKEQGPKYTVETKLNFFDKIETSGGFEIEYITSNDSKILIEADSVTHSKINIGVKENVLEISSNKIILKRVLCKLYSPSFNNLKTSSGTLFYTNDSLLYDTIKILATSGSVVKLKGFFGESDIKVNSGASVKIVGEGINTTINTSSGSDINNNTFKTINASINASSGSKVYVNSKNINAQTSSGATIFYNKDAVLTNISSSSGGSINPQN